MNTAVTALLGLGADAMDNLFDVEITLPTGVEAGEGAPDAKGLLDQFRIRCQGFTPPKFNVKTYDVKYKTIKIKRPASVMEGDRVFELQFRLDANYYAYKALVSWRAKTLIPSTGLAYNALDLANGGEVDVHIITEAMARPGPSDDGSYEAVSNGKSTSEAILTHNSWNFKDVWLTELSEPAFKQGGGDPIMITAKFAFGEFTDPGHIWGGYTETSPAQ